MILKTNESKKSPLSVTIKTSSNHPFINKEGVDVNFCNKATGRI